MSQKYIWIHWECLSVELSVLMASAQWRLDFLQVSYVTDLFPSNARSLFLNESRECWSSRNAGYLPDLHGSANTSQAVSERYNSKCPSTAAAATGRTDYIRLNVTTETETWIYALGRCRHVKVFHVSAWGTFLLQSRNQRTLEMKSHFGPSYSLMIFPFKYLK